MPGAVARGNFSQQGYRVTVNAMLNDPLFVRARLLDISRNQFMMESLLRNAGANNSGVVVYNESESLYADEDPSIVAEGAEIPLVTVSQGIQKAAFGVKTALGIYITRETRDRNRVDTVIGDINKVKNTFVRMWERRMFQALTSAAVPALPIASPPTSGGAALGWNNPAANIRMDVLRAIRAVREANQSGATPGPNVDDYLGFEPDTLVMSTRTEALFFGNQSVVDVYKNNGSSTLGDRQPLYTGTLEKTFMGLSVMTSRFMADDIVWVMERKTVGGWSDERPLGVTPLYEDKPRETWRADAVRNSVIFVDQPKAAVKLTGILTAVPA